MLVTIYKHIGKYKSSLFIGIKRRSTVPMPDLHVINEKCEVKTDFPNPLRKRKSPPKPKEQECSLIGQPTLLPSAVLQIREDVFEKWNQKPEKDIIKELVKKKFTY